MPWRYPDDVPRPAKNWTPHEQRVCTVAANAVLARGGSEQDAIFACIHAAGKSHQKESSLVIGDFQRFIPIAKVDEEQRIVAGYASTPTLDLDDEVVKVSAVKNALPDYMLWGNIREMHQPSAVGSAIESQSHMDDKGLWLGAYVSDDRAWQKCRPTRLLDGTLVPPVYKGFSIGGRVIRKSGNTIEELQLIEISLVDRPANPDCRIQIVKGAAPTDGEEARIVTEAELRKVSSPLPSLESETVPLGVIAKFLKSVGHRLQISKVPADREISAGADGLSGATGSPSRTHNSPARETGSLGHETETREEPDDTSLEERDFIEASAGDGGDPKKPYGDVHYADPGYQSDGKHRYPVDSEQHIRAAWSYIHKPKNRTPYSSQQLSHIEGAIAAAWRSKIDPKGPPSASDGKAAAAEVDWFADLGTHFDKCSLVELSQAMYLAQEAGEALAQEAFTEAGDQADMTLAHQADSIAAALARLVASVATHEAGELGALSSLKAADTGESAVTGIVISEELVKRIGAERIAHLERAAHHVERAVECCKGANSQISQLHTLHKEWATKVAKDAGAAFPAAQAMEHIHKAHGFLHAMTDHHEMSSHHIGKAVGNVHTGEAAQFTRDNVSGATMPDQGTQIPAVPGGKDAGATTGKFAGMTSEQIEMVVAAELKAAKAEGAMEAMSKMPAGARRGVQFDPTKIAAAGSAAGGAAGGAAKSAADLFLEGVSLGEVDQDGASRNAARAIGNMIKNSATFGKNPINDPNFRGLAG